jgi:AcrR family transcriptional regulator
VKSEGPDASNAPPTARRPRADAERNRERLLAAAKAAFAEEGAEVSLEAVARRAGVGIGTLYRRFPDREALLAAVYDREFQQFADAGERLMASTSAAQALEDWARLFVDYIATKKVIAPALTALAGQPPRPEPSAWDRMMGTMRALVDQAIEQGEIRPDANADDLFFALGGITYGNASPNWRESAGRLIGVLMDGLRTRPPG